MTPTDKNKADEKIAYVQEMLIQLANVARNVDANLLVYLINMAYEEARDAHNRLCSTHHSKKSPIASETMPPA